MVVPSGQNGYAHAVHSINPADPPRCLRVHPGGSARLNCRGPTRSDWPIRRPARVEARESTCVEFVEGATFSDRSPGEFDTSNIFRKDESIVQNAHKSTKWTSQPSPRPTQRLGSGPFGAGVGDPAWPCCDRVPSNATRVEHTTRMTNHMSDSTPRLNPTHRRYSASIKQTRKSGRNPPNERRCPQPRREAREPQLNPIAIPAPYRA